MSTAEQARNHLAQPKLSENDKAILAELEEWVVKAAFGEPPKKQAGKHEDDFEVCVDSERPQKWNLLARMDLVKEHTFRQWSIVRIPGPKSSPFYNTKGPAYICPIRIIRGSPMVSGRQLRVGESTYIKERVVVSPALEFLFLLE